ncbi:MAG: lysophospholipid acyltransferase family protein [Deltaproteobacteria bacterium]|nr:lysophospholipid acyltransferase family protein [Deltaproteobacteria bacterium]
MVVKESIARDVLRLFVWYPLRWMILAMPIAAGFKVLRTMGGLHCAFSRGRKALLKENLRRIDPSMTDVMAEEAVKEYFRNHYTDRLLIFIFPKFGKMEVGRFLSIEGIENLDWALKKGRGAILVHGHFGPVHLPLVALARLGYGMKQIGLPSDEGLSWIGRNVAFRLRLEYESLLPAEVIMADGFLRGAFKWLAGNGVIMITGDGSGTVRKVGRHSPFRLCGQSVEFPLGPALLSEKTGAELIPMFITPGDGKSLYRIVIETPIEKGEGGPEAMVSEFISRYERYIRKYPGYMHFLDKFSPGLFITR